MIKDYLLGMYLSTPFRSVEEDVLRFMDFMDFMDAMDVMTEGGGHAPGGARAGFS